MVHLYSKLTIKNANQRSAEIGTLLASFRRLRENVDRSQINTQNVFRKADNKVREDNIQIKKSSFQILSLESPNQFVLSGRSPPQKKTTPVYLKYHDKYYDLTQLGFQLKPIILSNTFEASECDEIVGPLVDLKVGLNDVDIVELFRGKDKYYQLGKWMVDTCLAYRKIGQIIANWSNLIAYQYYDISFMSYLISYTASTQDYEMFETTMEKAFYNNPDEYRDEAMILWLHELVKRKGFERYVSFDKIQSTAQKNGRTVEIQYDIIKMVPQGGRVYTNPEAIKRMTALDDLRTVIGKTVIWALPDYPQVTLDSTFDDEPELTGYGIEHENVFPWKNFCLAIQDKYGLDVGIHLANYARTPHLHCYPRGIIETSIGQLTNLEYAAYFKIYQHIVLIQKLQDDENFVTNRACEVLHSISANEKIQKANRTFAYGGMTAIQSRERISTNQFGLILLNEIIEEAANAWGGELDFEKLWVYPRWFNAIERTFQRAGITLKSDTRLLNEPLTFSLTDVPFVIDGTRKWIRNPKLDQPLYNINLDENESSIKFSDTMLRNNSSGTKAQLPLGAHLFNHPVFLPVNEPRNGAEHDYSQYMPFEIYYGDEEKARRTKIEHYFKDVKLQSSQKELSVMNVFGRLGYGKTRGKVIYLGVQRGTLEMMMRDFKSISGPLCNIIDIRHEVILNYENSIMSAPNNAYKMIGWDIDKISSMTNNYHQLSSDQQLEIKKMRYGDLIERDWSEVQMGISVYLRMGGNLLDIPYAELEDEDRELLNVYSYVTFPVTGRMLLASQKEWDSIGLEPYGKGAIASYDEVIFSGDGYIGICDIQINHVEDETTQEIYEQQVMDEVNVLFNAMSVGGIFFIKMNYIGDSLSEGLFLYFMRHGFIGFCFPTGKKTRNMEGYAMFRKRLNRPENLEYPEAYDDWKIAMTLESWRYLTTVNWLTEWVEGRMQEHLKQVDIGFYAFDLIARTIDFNRQDLKLLSYESSTLEVTPKLDHQGAWLQICGYRDVMKVDILEGYLNPERLINRAIDIVPGSVKEFMSELDLGEVVHRMLQREILRNLDGFDRTIQYGAGLYDIFANPVSEFNLSYDLIQDCRLETPYRFQGPDNILNPKIVELGLHTLSSPFAADTIAQSRNISLKEQLNQFFDIPGMNTVYFTFVRRGRPTRVYGHYIAGDRWFGPNKWSGGKVFNERELEDIPQALNLQPHLFTIKREMEAQRIPLLSSVYYRMIQDIIGNVNVVVHQRFPGT